MKNDLILMSLYFRNILNIRKKHAARFVSLKCKYSTVELFAIFSRFSLGKIDFINLSVVMLRLKIR